ncbi:Protoporphyrinogen IX oxidase, novel form, HemJ [hydrothermal vent metagenome]|uniref:Protoporphyrinogen IX oxidase, novel form, HemJ n=1 Tax=hydrothermal vent metagenome TaxID=652676 RepID=A0A3B0U5V7_9ZZZZ
MEWVKAFHVISVIAWMAGLLYLPRLFVYHCDSEKGSKQSQTFKIMERRLFFAIMTPAMISSWLFGLWLIFGFNVVDFSDFWIWIKMGGVLGLTAVHGLLWISLKEFSLDQNLHSRNYFRIFNEIPTLLMILIVIMVIVKPF